MEEHRQVWDRCLNLAAEGRIDMVEELLDRLVLDNPEDGQAWRCAGLIRYRIDDFEGGCDALEKAGRLAPLEPSSQLALAECLARTGRCARAGALLRDLTIGDGCPQALLPAVAAGLGHLGEYGAALRACLELARRSPGLAEAHFGIAFYLRRLGRPVEAILPIVTRAHELAPGVPLYRISLAMLLDHVGHGDRARELLRELDLDAVSCQGCLRRMATIFRDARPAHCALGLGASAN